MINLKDYFNKSVFVKGLDHPFSTNIAPSIDLSSLSEDEMNNIKYGMYKFNDFIYEGTDYSLSIRGYLKSFEKNNGRKIYDDINFDSYVSIEDEDLVMVCTDVSIERSVEGEIHDKVSVRDVLYPIGYLDTSYVFSINEYYVMIDNGRKVLHYSDLSDSVEVFELNEEYNITSGFKIGIVNVYNKQELNSDEPLFEEIRSVINSKKDVLQLIKR